MHSLITATGRIVLHKVHCQIILKLHLVLFCRPLDHTRAAPGDLQAADTRQPKQMHQDAYLLETAATQISTQEHARANMCHFTGNGVSSRLSCRL